MGGSGSPGEAAQQQEAQALLGLLQGAGGPAGALELLALLQAEAQGLEASQQVRAVELADGQPVDPIGEALCGGRGGGGGGEGEMVNAGQGEVK